MFYESRLESKDTSVYQGLIGIDALAGSKLWDFDVAHEACTSSCDEEVEAVLDLVTKLTSPGSRWIDADRHLHYGNLSARLCSAGDGVPLQPRQRRMRAVLSHLLVLRGETGAELALDAVGSAEGARETLELCRHRG